MAEAELTEAAEAALAIQRHWALELAQRGAREAQAQNAGHSPTGHFYVSRWMSSVTFETVRKKSRAPNRCSLQRLINRNRSAYYAVSVKRFL